MTLLWLTAVGLLVVALLHLVPPLLAVPAFRQTDAENALRRLRADQRAQIDKDLESGALTPQDRAQAIDELQRQVLEEARQDAACERRSSAPWMSWGVACALSIGLPTAALLLYVQIGNPRAATAQLQAAGQASTHASGSEDMDRMVGRLALRLRAQSDDLEGWIVLARSYEVLQRYDDAVAAYRRAMALAPNQPQLLADYADALGSARDGDLSGPAQAALDTALAIDAEHPKALALAGMAAFNRGELSLARRHWDQLRALLASGSEAALVIEANLARLNAAPTRIAGTVSIAAFLRDRVSPQDTVFVVARAPAAGGVPVAVLRLQVKDLPSKFVLDDSRAMSPDLPLSRFTSVSLDVRVTRSGNVAHRPGDLVGSIPDAALGQDDVVLVADEIVP